MVLKKDETSEWLYKTVCADYEHYAILSFKVVELKRNKNVLDVSFEFYALVTKKLGAHGLFKLGEGLYVLGVSVDKDLSAAKIHKQKNRYSFPSTWLNPQLKSELKKPSSVPVVMVHDKLGLMVQYEKGQMFAEDVQALSRWI